MSGPLVVIGDVVLDRDVEGSVRRLCPDAPAPVVDRERVVERAGGAGLAATLAAPAGTDVSLVAPIAADEGGEALRNHLADADVRLVAVADTGSTRSKTRVI